MGLLNVKVVKLYLEFGWGRDGIFGTPLIHPIQHESLCNNNSVVWLGVFLFLVGLSTKKSDSSITLS